jgi:glycosyltransferase involved in cell wall biosynthesis
MEAEGIEVVHIHTPLSTARLGASVARRLKIPMVGTYHSPIDAGEYRAHAGLGSSFFDRPAKWFVDYFYGPCDMVTVPTSEYAAQLDDLGLGYTIRVISNGIDLAKYQGGNDREIRNRYPGKIVLSVGRVAHEKNLMFLFEAWHRIQDEAHLIVIGGGPQEAELKEFTSRNRLKNVHFVGMIPHEELLRAGFHRAADVFVVTSMIETQGLSLMEAQANGLPAVGVDSGGTRDLIVEGENGFLIQPGDQDGLVEAILRLVRDDELRQEMKAAALREIQSHDLESVASDWQSIYEELQEKKGGHQASTTY